LQLGAYSPARETLHKHAFTGQLMNKIQPNGFYEGSNSPSNAIGTLGAFYNNQFIESREYYSEKSTNYVLSSTGSIKKITPTLIEGSSIERDEANKIISRMYFRLRKQ
jgi:hypothetical protein